MTRVSELTRIDISGLRASKRHGLCSRRPHISALNDRISKADETGACELSVVSRESDYRRQRAASTTLRDPEAVHDRVTRLHAAAMNVDEYHPDRGIIQKHGKAERHIR